MNIYIEPLKIAISSFPFVALIAGTVFAMAEYILHKKISMAKLIIFSIFVLYMICAYCLVVFPLPSEETAKTLSSHEFNIIPFSFIGDLIRENPLRISDFSTYIPALTHETVYVPLFNIIMTIPFGVFMKFFGFDLKRTAFLSLLLTLFFELTQLTGLYFIFDGSYRLCDIDDIMLNTLGGIDGFGISSIIMKIKNNISIEKKQVGHISGKYVFQ